MYVFIPCVSHRRTNKEKKDSSGWTCQPPTCEADSVHQACIVEPGKLGFTIHLDTEEDAIGTFYIKSVSPYSIGYRSGVLPCPAVVAALLLLQIRAGPRTLIPLFATPPFRRAWFAPHPPVRTFANNLICSDLSLAQNALPP